MNEMEISMSSPSVRSIILIPFLFTIFKVGENTFRGSKSAFPFLSPFYMNRLKGTSVLPFGANYYVQVKTLFLNADRGSWTFSV